LKEVEVEMSYHLLKLGQQGSGVQSFQVCLLSRHLWCLKAVLFGELAYST